MDHMERFDSCYASVTRSSQHGIFLRLENGTNVFAFHSALPAGTIALVSLQREAGDGRLARVSVDSLLVA